ncbi:hypothetical protein FE257_002874 [Aspergillus nanangensis]|uniref:DUF7703 domain-containing protein n=1 Tax=Aspergillus nanangensis TaxID=2582783 RepID=A0AAD4GWJ5_ASPNN|nr:hypothetical protein FE257_002874 [Aspergillus nanangensis]
MSLPNIGSTFGSTIPLSSTYVVACLLSIALYNFIELNFLLFLTFKRRTGLYFWSFLIATWGIAIYSVGFLLRDFLRFSSLTYLYVTMIILGWSSMVTGQSLVLYSRLHLIVRNRIILRLVLAMIVLDAIILHIPTTVLCFGANSPDSNQFDLPYSVFERVQVTIFFVQESLISGLYMYQTAKLMYGGGALNQIHGEAGRALMVHLILMNVIVVLLDTTILVLAFTGRYASQTAAKGFIYSVKLKVEFEILNRLVKLARHTSDTSSHLEYGVSDPSAGSNGQGEGAQSNGEVKHRRRHSCPWKVFTTKVKNEVAGPAGPEMRQSL